jgi:hypothetical protein
MILQKEIEGLHSMQVELVFLGSSMKVIKEIFLFYQQSLYRYRVIYNNIILKDIHKKKEISEYILDKTIISGL